MSTIISSPKTKYPSLIVVGVSVFYNVSSIWPCAKTCTSHSSGPPRPRVSTRPIRVSIVPLAVPLASHFFDFSTPIFRPPVHSAYSWFHLFHLSLIRVHLWTKTKSPRSLAGFSLTAHSLLLTAHYSEIAISFGSAFFSRLMPPIWTSFSPLIWFFSSTIC